MLILLAPLSIIFASSYLYSVTLEMVKSKILSYEANHKIPQLPKINLEDIAFYKSKVEVYKEKMNNLKKKTMEPVGLNNQPLNLPPLDKLINQSIDGVSQEDSKRKMSQLQAVYVSTTDKFVIINNKVVREKEEIDGLRIDLIYAKQGKGCAKFSSGEELCI